MLKKTIAACLLLMVATFANGFQTTLEWMKYSSVEGRYSVLLPRQPKLSSQEVLAETGEKLQQYLSQSSDSDSMYMVSYFDILPGTTFSLEKGRDGMVASTKGTLLSDSVISLEGNPGRDYKLSAMLSNIEVLMRSRIYVAGGNRVYILQHMFQKSSDSQAMARKTAKFFDSFKVTASK